VGGHGRVRGVSDLAATALVVISYRPPTR
jgi:hypothetical protein